MYNNKPWRQTAPKCVPYCRKGCQNGGTCIAPSQCQCSPGFKGETCEVKECPEPSFPDAQASIVRTDDELRVECHEGYVLLRARRLGVAVCRDLPGTSPTTSGVSLISRGCNMQTRERDEHDPRTGLNGTWSYFTNDH
ncbi:protein kinase C-binding protein NELL2-like [Penaeus japonicus]|uniref:protein kinase C-binding protein NELL2-like n=1 Tax=Penaeus japonicus TaxID=27405 RepID=UPI001C710DED|nr:protein kinase C-binding protein NELL2-like [Penaeus japonicus]